LLYLTALYIQDYILTFPLEVSLVWTSKKARTVTALFLVGRYFSFAYLVLQWMIRFSAPRLTSLIVSFNQRL